MLLKVKQIIRKKVQINKRIQELRLQRWEHKRSKILYYYIYYIVLIAVIESN